MDLEQWKKDRDEAFLSLDESKIRAYAEKYGATLPSDERTFWAGVHKAITSLPHLPSDVRLKSEKWLYAHNLSSWGSQ
jgi:hypothetical protein